MESIDSDKYFSGSGENRRKPCAVGRIIERREAVFPGAFNEHPDGKVYTLQVAQDRSSDEQVERNFALLFWWFFQAAFSPRL